MIDCSQYVSSLRSCILMFPVIKLWSWHLPVALVANIDRGYAQKHCGNSNMILLSVSVMCLIDCSWGLWLPFVNRFNPHFCSLCYRTRSGCLCSLMRMEAGKILLLLLLLLLCAHLLSTQVVRKQKHLGFSFSIATILLRQWFFGYVMSLFLFHFSAYNRYIRSLFWVWIFL